MCDTCIVYTPRTYERHIRHVMHVYERHVYERPFFDETIHFFFVKILFFEISFLEKWNIKHLLTVPVRNSEI